MSEFKGTPGPWIVKTHKLFSGKSLIGSVADAKGNSIRVTGFALSSGDEAEANATLCAAAPDLLEALQDIINDGFLSDSKAHQARAVIKKALGEDE